MQASAHPYLPARAHIKQSVAQHAEAWAATIRTEATAQFKEDVAAALHECLRKHIAAQNRLFKRPSDLRREFIKLAKQATMAAEELGKVQIILARLPPMYHDPAFRMPPLSSTEYDLFGLAEAARHHAKKAVDFGGRERMWAFTALAEGLAQAFQRAAGRAAKVTWSEHHDCYEGRFIKFVETAVLPVVLEIAKTATGQPLPIPRTAKARGKFLQRLTAPGGVKFMDITPR
jgi:hypothetical protein